MISSNIPTGTTPSIKDAQYAQNFQEITNKFVTNVIKDENGDRRIIFGRLPDGTYGLVVSEEGTDVLTLF